MVLWAGALHLEAQPSPTPDQKFWMPNGPINSIVATNNTVYLGGDFTYVGPHTGPIAVFDATTGQLLSKNLAVGGTLKAVVPDGNGGWYVGGTFTNIAGISITNLAHLDGSLNLDTSFNAGLAGTAVNALWLDGTRLYVGGSLTRVNFTANSGGLFGLSTIKAALEWNPALSGTVNALALNAGLIYAGGSFFSVGSSNNQNLAAISTNATALATAWKPNPDTTVFALQISGTNAYVGGQFATIGTNAAPRNRLAAVSLATGAAGSWNPNPNGIVRALWVTATNAYVAGDFTTIAVASRRGFASLGLTGAGTAQPLDFQFQTVATANVIRSLLLVGNTIYAGGQFTNALGQQASVIACTNTITATATNCPLGSDFNGAAGAAFGANAMAVSGNQIAMVGDFQSVGGVARVRAAALSMATGTALPWAPQFSAPVLSMAMGNGVLYVGGSFTNLNTTNLVQGLASVDPVSGSPNTGFIFRGTNGSSLPIINALVFSPANGLYVGGAFTTVSGTARRSLALLDQNTGALQPGFNANLGGGSLGITAMVLNGANLYIGGDFTTVNAGSLPRLALVSATDGSTNSWAPVPNQTVTTLAASADTLYVGGNFTTVLGGTITLRNFAAFSLADQSLVPIDAALPTFAGGVTALGATTTVIYLGGSFTGAGGANRANIACLSPVDASAFDWNPSMDVGPTDFTLTDNYAFAGGPFRFIGGAASGFFAAFSRAPQFFGATVIDPSTVQFSLTTGDRTDVVLQWSPDLKSGVWTNINTNSPGFNWTFQVDLSDPQGFLRAVAR